MDSLVEFGLAETSASAALLFCVGVLLVGFKSGGVERARLTYAGTEGGEVGEDFGDAHGCRFVFLQDCYR